MTSENRVRDDTTTVVSYPTNLDYAEVPLSALRSKGRALLSRKLNRRKILLTELGLFRDWRGLSHCAELPIDEIRSSKDYTAKAILLWCNEINEKTPKAHFANLVKALEKIDRFDVADDLKEFMEEDAKFYIENRHKTALQSVARCPNDSQVVQLDNNILTRQDAEEGCPQTYDALILFAYEDIDFATKLIDELENFGLRLFVKDRDLLGGLPFEHVAVSRLVSERCNRVVAICSPAFLASPVNAFFINYAQALGIEQRTRKIIPCIIKPCEMPPALHFCCSLHYERAGKLFNFWERLYRTLCNTPQYPTAPSYRVTITEVDSVPSAPPAIEHFNENESPNCQKLYTGIEPAASKMDENYKFNSNTLKASSSSLKIMPPSPRMRNSQSLVNLSNGSVNGTLASVDLAEQYDSEVSKSASKKKGILSKIKKSLKVKKNKNSKTNSATVSIKSPKEVPA